MRSYSYIMITRNMFLLKMEITNYNIHMNYNSITNHPRSLILNKEFFHFFDFFSSVNSILSSGTYNQALKKISKKKKLL